MEHAHSVYVASGATFWTTTVLTALMLVLICSGLCFVGIASLSVWAHGRDYRLVDWGTVPVALILGALVLAIIWFDPVGILLRWLNYRRNRKLYEVPRIMEFEDSGFVVAMNTLTQRFK